MDKDPHPRQLGRWTVSRGRAGLIGLAVASVAFAGVPANATAGALDPTFGGTGVVESTKLSFTSDTAQAVLTSEGTVTLVGSRENFDTGELSGVVLRYLDNGTPDPSFGGGDGEVILSMGGPTQLYDGALLPDGRIVVAGQVDVNPDEIDFDFGVAVLTSAGAPDTTFDGDGAASVSIGSSLGLAYGVTVDAQGRIVVVGRAQASALVMGMARFEPDGDLDPTFSDDGVLTVPYRGGAVAYDVAMRGNKIVVVGTARQFARFALLRLLDDGSLDSAFGDGGKVIGARSPYVTSGARGVAIQSDGRILVAGGSHEFIVARFLPRGGPDTTFSGDGYARAFPESLEVIARDVIVQPSGKIVAVGGDGGIDLAIARFRANGSLDPSLSGDGRIVREKSFDGFGVAIDGSGRLLVAGGWFTMFCARYQLT